MRCISHWELVKYEEPQLLGQKKHQGNNSVISDNPVSIKESKQDFLSVGPAGTAALTAG